MKIKNHKKGQVGPREIISILVLLIVLSFILPLLTNFLNAIASGNIASSTDALINAMIPLIIIAAFFEFLRRFFV